MPSKEVLCVNLNHLTHRHKNQQLIFWRLLYRIRYVFFSYEFHYFVAKAKLNFLSTNPKYRYALNSTKGI